MGKENGIESAWITFHLGRTQERNGKYKEALSYYTDAVALDETFSDAWFYKFKLHLQLGQREEAKESAKRAISLDSKWEGIIAEYIEEAQRLTTEIRNADRTFKHFIEAVKEIALNLDFPTSTDEPDKEVSDLYYKGRGFEKAGKEKEALELYRKVNEIDETFAKAWFQRFMIHYTKKELEEAKECAAKAIALDSRWLKIIEDAIDPRKLMKKEKLSTKRRTPIVVEQQRKKEQTAQPLRETVIFRGALSVVTSDFRGMGPQKIIHPETSEEWIIEVSLNETKIHSYESPRGKISSIHYGPKERRLLEAAVKTSEKRFPDKAARVREMRKKISGN